jgi:chromosomal replication initiation ATPase DnaA
VGEGAALVLEDADRSSYDERALFHLLNLAREKLLFVLLSARSAPSRWDISLPDLSSRLSAVPIVEIGAPDEALLRMVMLKHFADRQLNVDPKVLEFRALHVDRSLQAAAAAVGRSIAWLSPQGARSTASSSWRRLRGAPRPTSRVLFSQLVTQLIRILRYHSLVQNP